MSHPLYNPYASGNQSSTQGPYGLSSISSERDPRRASSRLGPGSSFTSSGASSATPANLLMSQSQSGAIRGEDIKKPIDIHNNTSREEMRLLSKPMHQHREQGTRSMTQRDEFCSSGTGMSSYPKHYKITTADYSSKSHSPSASSNCTSGGESRFKSYTSESAANILLHFGLEKEDLEHLIAYPEDQITPANLPVILRQIRIQKGKQTTTAVQSKPYPEPQPTRSVSGGAEKCQQEMSSAVLQPSKVIDYGHTGKYTGGVGDETVRTSGGRANSGGSGSMLLMDPYDSSSRSREPLQKNPTEVKSSAKGSSHDQASPVTSLSSSYSSLLSSVASTSTDKTKRLQTQPVQTSKILSSVSLPKKDTDIRVLKSEASKPVPLKSINDTSVTTNQSKSQGHGSTVAEQTKKQQMQKQPVSQTKQASKALPALTMMHDYVAASPRIFPHTCSLCSKECTRMTDWLAHHNTSLHLDRCRRLRRQYPEWNGEIALCPRAAGRDANPPASTSAQKTRHGSRSRSPSPDPRRHPGSEGKREKCGSRSRSPHSSRYNRRSQLHSPSPLHDRPTSSRYRSHSRSPERRSSTEGSSPARKKSTNAERPVKKQLETSAAQSLSTQSVLEAVVKSLAPALMAELAKMKSSSSSTAKKTAKLSKAKPSQQKSEASSSTKTKETDSKKQKKPPPKKPASSSVSTHQTSKSTTTSKKVLVSTLVKSPFKGPLPSGAKKGATGKLTTQKGAAKGSVKGLTTVTKAKVLVSKVKNVSTKQMAKTGKLPAKGAVKKAVVNQKGSKSKATGEQPVHSKQKPSYKKSGPSVKESVVALKETAEVVETPNVTVVETDHEAKRHQADVEPKDIEPMDLEEKGIEVAEHMEGGSCAEGKGEKATTTEAVAETSADQSSESQPPSGTVETRPAETSVKPLLRVQQSTLSEPESTAQGPETQTQASQMQQQAAGSPTEAVEEKLPGGGVETEMVQEAYCSMKNTSPKPWKSSQRKLRPSNLYTTETLQATGSQEGSAFLDCLRKVEEPVNKLDAVMDSMGLTPDQKSIASTSYEDNLKARAAKYPRGLDFHVFSNDKLSSPKVKRIQLYDNKYRTLQDSELTDPNNWGKIAIVRPGWVPKHSPFGYMNTRTSTEIKSESQMVSCFAVETPSKPRYVSDVRVTLYEHPHGPWAEIEEIGKNKAPQFLTFLVASPGHMHASPPRGYYYNQSMTKSIKRPRHSRGGAEGVKKMRM